MINVLQLKELIIKPALLDLVAFSEDALELLVFTCCTESRTGTYLKLDKDNRLGIYQMRAEAHIHLWESYIKSKPDLLLKLVTNFDISRMPSEDRLIYDLRYATAMARIFYLQVYEPIPSKDDLEAIWNYYNRYYNLLGRDKDVSLAAYFFLTHQ